MILIFEGVDKSGKTTLRNDVARELRKSYGGDRIVEYKATIKPTSAADAHVAYLQYKAIFDLANQNPDKLFILDRSYISEMVYSQVMRCYEGMLDERYAEFLDRKDVLIVHVDAEDDVLKERFIAQGETYVGPEHISSLKSRYDDLFTGRKLHLLKIQTPSDHQLNTEIVVSEVAKMFKV